MRVRRPKVPLQSLLRSLGVDPRGNAIEPPSIGEAICLDVFSTTKLRIPLQEKGRKALQNSS